MDIIVNIAIANPQIIPAALNPATNTMAILVILFSDTKRQQGILLAILRRSDTVNEQNYRIPKGLAQFP